MGSCREPPYRMKLAVIGDPVAHSRSPAIHTAALRALGIEGSYVGVRVAPDDVEAMLARVRNGEFDGINVTMPHKRAAAEMVDDLSDDARRSASVNTVVRGAGGRLSGHSTDVTALRRLWKQTGIPVDRPALVLGAGGAAAAACLAAPSPTVYLSARRSEAARALTAAIDRPAVVVPWQSAVSDSVVINATALGMKGEELAGRVMVLASGLVDMAYGSDVTPAVAAARQRGLPVADGLEILVAQAGDSFRLWTGREPPWEAMAQAARNPSRPGAGQPNHAIRRRSEKENPCRSAES